MQGYKYWTWQNDVIQSLMQNGHGTTSKWQTIDLKFHFLLIFREREKKCVKVPLCIPDFILNLHNRNMPRELSDDANTTFNAPKKIHIHKSNFASCILVFDHYSVCVHISWMNFNRNQETQTKSEQMKPNGK